MSNERRLFALRGAVQAGTNESEPIISATEELVRALLQRNDLEPGQFVSCLFTATNDLDADFPAVAARRLGFEGVPLLCAREIDVPGSMPRVIRIMAHYYADAEHTPSHVYLGETHNLRADLQHAQ